MVKTRRLDNRSREFKKSKKSNRHQYLRKKDEGELTVAKRLLSRVAKEHKSMIGIVVYDASAYNSS